MSKETSAPSWKAIVFQTLIAAVLSAGALGGFLNYWWVDPRKSTTAWKESSLEQVIAPVVLNLDRTKIANARYISSKQFGFAAILAQSNRNNRDILLAKGHLIPDDLLEAANCLVAHYDIWIARYEATLGAAKPSLVDIFELGFPDLSFEPCSEFPKSADAKFREVFARFRRDVKKDG